MSLDDNVRRLLRAAWFTLIQVPERFLIARHSPHGNATFFDPRAFPWTSDLEANWKTIRDELERIIPGCLPNFQDLAKEITITDDDRWKTYFLYFFGHKLEENCARCPETARLIEQVPGMTTAFFSILSPHKHLPEHRGPYKGLLRYHLGLKIPEPKEACRIRVGDDVAHWEEGESLMFDDTHPHEVWNDTEEKRAVLFMDVIRPLPSPASALNEWFIELMSRTPQVRRTLKNQRQWAEQFEKAGQSSSASFP